LQTSDKNTPQSIYEVRRSGLKKAAAGNKISVALPIIKIFKINGCLKRIQIGDYKLIMAMKKI
jgi:hypothetical protein